MAGTIAEAALARPRLVFAHLSTFLCAGRQGQCGQATVKLHARQARELRLGRVDLPTAEGGIRLPLKVLKEVGPALRMLSFDEAALVCAVIENALHPISIKTDNSVNHA